MDSIMMDSIMIEYLQRSLEENTLLKLKELFSSCKVVLVNTEECGDAQEGNGYVLVQMKFARNGKVGGNG